MSKRIDSFLKFAGITVLLLACALVSTSSGTGSGIAAASPAPAEKALSPKDRLEVFDDVWKNINERYYDPEFHGVNWEEVGHKYRPQVESVKNDQEFYTLLSRMTGELHDAHTRFNSPAAWENRQKQQGFSIGFMLAPKDGKTVVTRVAPDSNAAHAGIEPGMILVSVDGKPIEERIAELSKTVLASSTQRITQLRLYGSVFQGAPDATFKITLQRADGSTFDVSLSKQILPQPPDVNSKLLPSGDAYIRFDGFQPGVEKEFKEALEKFHDAPGLIVDPRQNGGGRADILSTIAGYFFNEKTEIAEYLTRKDISSEESSGTSKAHRKMIAGKNGGQIYAGPVAILTMESTGSSSEIFSAGLQENGRAVVVGSQTCGCVIGISSNQKMKGGGVLEISQILFFSPKGRKLEGEGVIPDKGVVPSIADLQQKHDVVLDQADEILKGMTTTKVAAGSQ